MEISWGRCLFDGKYWGSPCKWDKGTLTSFHYPKFDNWFRYLGPLFETARIKISYLAFYQTMSSEIWFGCLAC